MIDRGGLWYIKESTHSVFAIEEEARQCLKASCSQHLKYKQGIVKIILSNEDVRYQVIYCLLVKIFFPLFSDQVERMAGEVLQSKFA